MSAKNSQTPTSDDDDVHQWKIRKLIKSFEQARGNGTSMISLIIPPKDQISRYSKMLSEEYGTASNIKNRVNRLSVLGAITSTQQKLKLYNKVPDNGLIIYCGTILTEDGKEKRVNYDLEPHKPINTSLYLCDNKFHTECLSELLDSDEKYGFIVIDGSGCLFGHLAGNTRTVLHKYSVELPKKHGRGGQSAVRFARLRTEKRHNYLRKVAEMAVQFFITNDRPNVSGLVLAGLADFKTELSQTDMFDQRLKKVIIGIVDVSYGGDNGFNQAIELSQENLKELKFMKEKKAINVFFEEIAQDTGKFCFGVKDTMHALEAGSLDTLLIYEELDLNRVVLKSPTGETKILFLSADQAKSEYNKIKGVEWEIAENELLVEWFIENYKDYSAKLQFVTNKSQEGAQFQKGFGGIGGILRYPMDFTSIDVSDDEEEEVYDSEEEYDFDF